MENKVKETKGTSDNVITQAYGDMVLIRVIEELESKNVFSDKKLVVAEVLSQGHVTWGDNDPITDGVRCVVEFPVVGWDIPHAGKPCKLIRRNRILALL